MLLNMCIWIQILDKLCRAQIFLISEHMHMCFLQFMGIYCNLNQSMYDKIVHINIEYFLNMYVQLVYLKINYLFAERNISLLSKSCF